MDLEANYYYYIRGLKLSLVAAKTLQKNTKYERPINMDYREQGSHARGVYPTQEQEGRNKRKKETKKRRMKY